jgi:hypothetical protein
MVLTRLSPTVRHHINMLGRYSFTLSEPVALLKSSTSNLGRMRASVRGVARMIQNAAKQ